VGIGTFLVTDMGVSINGGIQKWLVYKWKLLSLAKIGVVAIKSGAVIMGVPK